MAVISGSVKCKAETGDQEAVLARCRRGIGCRLLLLSPFALMGWGGPAGLAADALDVVWV